MRIYAMTATFGKLEHETLTLTPGLNIIEAPNEWGKSTWCAFLTAMLYGIATREHTTRSALADKERYAPWSGSPMSGRIDLNWNGRDITIERRTKGRNPLGEFSAYETGSGLAVQELTADNCGQQLLGVEKSVFLRSAFVRLADLPLTQDEALRRRLNALVTTGDESADADTLAQKLRELKNRCRANRANGLIPQAESQRDSLLAQQSSLTQLHRQSQQLQQQEQALNNRLAELHNHQAALRYTAAQVRQQHLTQAQAEAAAAQAELESQKALCADLPTREAAAQQLQALEAMQTRQSALQGNPLPTPPEAPADAVFFTGLTPEAALQQASSDRQAYEMLTKPLSPALLLTALLLLLAGAALCFYRLYLGLAVAAIALLPVLLHYRSKRSQTRDRAAISLRYGTLAPQQWEAAAEHYGAYRRALEAHSSRCAAQQADMTALQAQLQALTGGQPLGDAMAAQRQILSHWDALAAKETACGQARAHAETLRAVVQPVPQAALPDSLTLSTQETDREIADTEAALHQLRQRLGQCQGQMQALGDENALNDQLAQVTQRLEALGQTYEAVLLAQSTLTEAANALQRRFAPQISQRAQTLFSQLTGSRYDRLTLAEDLAVQAGAQGEDTLRSALWRSDGTADQLYLAVRLAVSEALIAQAPLILDDALVRFDDRRLEAALSVLQAQAEHRQILLFTCQSRESQALAGR